MIYSKQRCVVKDLRPEPFQQHDIAMFMGMAEEENIVKWL